jgi:chaperone BCS1
MLTEIQQDMTKFFASKNWYMEHGIPYQRGYLLLGSPGNGKTSSVVALASYFKRDIYIMSLATMCDTSLMSVMAELPEHALVLIEDVDCLFQKRERQGGMEPLTFSGFLNAIDGVSSAPGHVLFMTTNHLELLDPALIRPSRVDRRFEFKNADPDMAERLFEQFFPGVGHLAKHFGNQVREAADEFSMAALQEHLLTNRDSAVAASNLKVGRDS